MKQKVEAALMLAAAIGVLAGCGGENAAADPTACKAAMPTSTTGPAVWATDKSSWPDACKGMDDGEFNKLAAEWYDEFQRELAAG